MGWEELDRYLLGEPVDKPALVRALLTERSPAPAAAPFYRALEAIGARAADEALIALRIAAGGETPTDARVRRIRALAAVARSSAAHDARALNGILKRDGAALRDLARSEGPPDFSALGQAARAAYAREFAR